MMALSPDVPLSGRTDPTFARVREVFAELLRSGAETGAAFAVLHRGRAVVDLCGGWADTARSAPWTSSTLVNTFSASKPVVALGLLLLVEQGRVALDDPVARYWPEYAVEGKGGTTVRGLLAHQAGLPAFPRPLAAEAVSDWNLLASELASAAPEWVPGTAHGEHALTYGHLVGEIIRRVDGRSPGRFLADELAGPWGLDLRLGLSEEDIARTGELEYGTPDWPQRVGGEPGSLWARALGNPTGCLNLQVLNSPLWRAAQVPAANIHATATSLAKLYGGLLAGGEVDGVRLIGRELVAELVTVQAEGHDLLLSGTKCWGLGVSVDTATAEWGMGGIGGCYAGAQPKFGYTVAYTTRRLDDHRRVDALIDTFESCL